LHGDRRDENQQHQKARPEGPEDEAADHVCNMAFRPPCGGWVGRAELHEKPFTLGREDTRAAGPRDRL
jgi:hypothetical protein